MGGGSALMLYSFSIILHYTWGGLVMKSLKRIVVGFGRSLLFLVNRDSARECLLVNFG